MEQSSMTTPGDYWKGREAEYYILDGILYLNEYCPIELLKAAQEYDDIRSDDVIIMGYPKSGNHLAADIVRKLRNKGDIDKSVKEACDVFLGSKIPEPLNYNPNVQVPITMEEISRMKSPRVLNTHFHYHQLPTKAQSGLCKIIYISRDPRDVACSWFNMFDKTGTKFRAMGLYNGPIEDWSAYVREFIRGTVFYGPWSGHIRNFLAVKERPHILWIKFEELKANMKDTVKRIHDFLGENLDGDAIDRVAESCSIEEAKKQYPTSVFIDKGNVGDWKTKFTVAESESLDEQLRKDLQGYEHDLSMYLK